MNLLTGHFSPTMGFCLLCMALFMLYNNIKRNNRTEIDPSAFPTNINRLSFQGNI